MEVQKRLQQLIAAMGYKSVKSFEEECGLSNGLAMKLTARTTERTWRKITNAFPLVNIDWLKTGEGEMFNPVSQTITNQQTNGDNSPGTSIVYNSDEIIKFMRQQIFLKDKQIERLQNQVANLIDTIAKNQLVGK